MFYTSFVITSKFSRLINVHKFNFKRINLITNNYKDQCYAIQIEDNIFLKNHLRASYNL